MNNNIGNHPFLFLNSHKKEYYKKLSKVLDNKKEYVLEKVFFLPENIKLIQKQLIISVYHNSNKKYKIPFQNNDSILLTMKYIFNFYAQHLPFNIKKQIKDLNDMVVKELTPNIIMNLNSYYKYLEDAQNSLHLIDRPLNVSSTGNRTLASTTSLI